MDNFEDLATASPILFIRCMYSATCLFTGFLGPYDDAIDDWPVLILLLDCDGRSAEFFLGLVLDSIEFPGFCYFGGSFCFEGSYFPLSTTYYSSS